ncbi:MAG: MgtC/SapB family protein [Clostridium sp.]|nr:MgtC/SapB family protein [Clostridium sp.]MCI7441965.1 MgtC/SapB family protein [Clostridium sp.]
MANILYYLREINTASIIIRLTLAVIFSGIIGLERGRKRRPAGLRTHILVCVGSTVVMITSQYMTDILGNTGDIARLGAQVISGIGFLGAGTIIIDGKNKVKGLTTAAGLWACACMGLAIGIGFYEGAIITCIFLLGVMTGLHKLDLYLQGNSKVIDIYAEFDNISAVTDFISNIKETGARVSDIEMKKSKESGGGVGVIMTLKLLEKCDHTEYLINLHKSKGIQFVEEIA